MEMLILFFLVSLYRQCKASCVEHQYTYKSTLAARTVICHLSVLDSTVYEDYILKLPEDTVKLSIICIDENQPSFMLQDMFVHLHRMKSLNIKDCVFSYFPTLFANNNSMMHISVDSAKTLVIDGHAFLGLTQLKTLSLTNCGLTKVPSICSLKYLQQVNVSNNILRYIDNLNSGCHNGIGLIFLRSIDIRNNNIINIPETFSHLCPNLTHFYAGDNHIQYIPVGSFSEFDKIQWLDLSNNKIRRLPEYLLPDTERLKVLMLGNNPLEYIPDTLLNAGQVYNYLDISYLNLNDTIWDRLKYIRLNELSLNGNNLTAIPGGLLSKQFNLTHLHVAENSLHYVAEDTFLASSIQYLDLRGNRISKLSNRSLHGLENLVHLDISSNAIEDFQPFSFSDMPMLTRLYIQENRLHDVPDFTGLSSLQILDMRDNNITQLRSDDLKGLKELIGISLAFNNISHVPYGVFQRCPKILVLNLRKNVIKFIDNRAFRHLGNIELILLDYNEISDISDIFIDVPVKLLWLDANKLTKIRNGDLPDTLTHVMLSRNYIYFVEGYVFYRMSNLIQVDLRYNAFRTFFSIIVFETSPHVTAAPSVYLRGNHLICDCKLTWFKRWIGLTLYQPHFPDLDQVFCADKLNRPFSQVSESEFVCWYDTVYTFGKYYECPIECNCSRTSDMLTHSMYCHSIALKYIPSFPVIATNLYLQNNNIAHLPVGCFNNLTRVRILDLSGNRLNTLEDGVFGQLQSLETLHLNNNNLVKINNKTFDGLENLRHLYLQNNKIMSIPSHVLNDFPNLSHLYTNVNNLTSLFILNDALLENITVLKISENPWMCNCKDMLSFQALFLEHSHNIIDANETHCLLDTCKSDCDTTSPNYISYKINNFPLSEFCENTTVVYSNLSALNVNFFEDTSRVMALSMFLIFLVIATILSAIIVKKRDLIRVYIYASFGWRIFDQRRTLDESGMIYDAFVSYSSKDEDFIVHNLAPVLESRKEEYKLCLHYRDFPVGASIAETIVEYINQSKRTIMVLSNNYLQSEWCHLEFKTAHKQVLKDKRNRLIVILLGDINNDELDDDIKLYFETKTYVRYDDPWFWKKLLFALPQAEHKPV